MPSAKPSFRLVVYQHQLDPHIFREILADKLNLNRTDAMRLVSHAPGVIPWPLSRRRASRLARLLASVGVHVGVWRDDRLPKLREPSQVHKLACQVDGLATFGIRGETLHWVPWTQIELINVGEFSETSNEQSPFGPTWFSASVGAVRSLVTGHHRSRASVRKAVPRPFTDLWIVRCRPTQIISIQQDQVNYEYLQDRRKTSARANFRLLIEDLIRFAPDATLTPATRSFLKSERPGHYQFATSQQFKDYTAWQLLVRWRDRSRSAGSEP